MTQYVLNLEQIDTARFALAGGKATNLGEIFKIQGIAVPAGFCVTTEAFKECTASSPDFHKLLALLTAGSSHDSTSVSSRIRTEIERLALPEHIESLIRSALGQFAAEESFAVRSSATAEDLPTASFAGLQDTYLNITGADQVLRHITKCWASLFTDRAIAYRQRNGIGHETVSLAVVVQKMVHASVSGVMFTADPMTSDRKALVIDAAPGYGMTLVSGTVNPDYYRVRDDGIEARPNAGALSEEQIKRLFLAGRKIESHFGQPQDIEWSISGDQLWILQSRPITTLFPPPESADGSKRAFMSIGHMQVMTDPMLPLGMSVFELGSFFTLHKAGGRLFADITHDLGTAFGRRMVRQKTENMDPLMASSVKGLMNRKDYVKSIPRGPGMLTKGVSPLPWLKEAFWMYMKNDPSVLNQLIDRHEASLRQLESTLSGKNGVRLFNSILQDKKNLQAALYDATGFGSVIVCQFVSAWLNRNLEKWLSERNITDELSKSVDHNVTSEMGLALCDVADVVRNHPDVMKYLEKPRELTFWDDLAQLQGGTETIEVLKAFLERYGARCPGEIDITRPRWREDPSQLAPLILSDVRSLAPGEHRERFEAGRRAALDKQQQVLDKLNALPGGSRKARQCKKMMSVFRNFVGAREYPKYFWIKRNDIYKRALVSEADRLVSLGILADRTDAYYLYLDEFARAAETGVVDHELIRRRRTEYALYQNLVPPRIIMSDGEVPRGEYKKDIPAAALSGVAVSSGIVEGPARVLDSLEDANVMPGDILVTTYTDPSWTPVFMSIAGLVTEVGGMMSHGAVITREYGLPAVAGVENATRLIRNGQRIRLNGTDGYVEIIGE